MNDRTITLDVREDLLQGRTPCDRIFAQADALGTGESFRLVAPFEPVPLFSVLGRKGFSHLSQRAADGAWEILFTREQPGEPDAAPGCSSEAAPRCGEAQIELDVRGLEPPQPMVRILESLAALPPATTLGARTDRRPLHLLAELTARGYLHRSEEQPDGSFVTHIRRA
jgi:uncharacterized protein (DUF2249 family)